MQVELRKAPCLVNVVSGVAPCWSYPTPPPPVQGVCGAASGTVTSAFPSPQEEGRAMGMVAPAVLRSLVKSFFSSVKRV